MPESEKPRGCIDCRERGKKQRAYCSEKCRFVARKREICGKFVWRKKVQV